MSNINLFVNLIWSNRCICFWEIYWICRKRLYLMYSQFYLLRLCVLEGKWRDTKKQNKNFIMKQEPNFTITSPMRLLEEKSKNLPEVFVKNMIVPWIEENVQVVAQLSIIYVRSKKIHKEDHMCMGIYFDKHILIYVDFSRILNVILRFHELSTDFLEDGITFTLSNSERATERRKSYRWS